MPDLKVTVGERNGDGKRSVVYEYDGAEYPDTIVVENAFIREKSLERAASFLGLQPGDIPKLAAELVRLAREKDQGDGTDAVHFQGISCAELAAGKYDTEFLIDHTLVARQPAMVAAAFKGMKTIISADGAISLATATPFLGKLAVQRAVSVGFMSGEGGLSVLQDYARRVANGRGIELEDISGLVWCDTLPQLADLRHLDALEQFILEYELEVVWFDPAYLCIPGDDAGNLLKQGKLLRRVNETCVKHGCTPVLVHHTKKSVVDPHAPAELADIAWSGFAEYAGQWWLLSRREKYDADQPGEHKLWLNIGGRAGHSALHALDIHEGQLSDPGGRHWEVEVLTPSEAREGIQDHREARKAAARDEQLEGDKRALVNALAKYPEGETERTLHGASGLYATRFRAALAELVQLGDVVSCEVSRRNRKTPYEGWKLGETGTTHE